MSFLNLDYLYQHLPARYRRDDSDLFLKRLLSPFGEELDKFDATPDTFFEKIAPESAPEEFLDWWLWAWFGWAWFPAWFTVAQKRAFYADIAKHYARRGTREGIQGFLRAFGIRARVTTEPQYWGELTFGEDTWTMTGPLVIIIQVFPSADALPEDLNFWGELTFGEDHFATPRLTLERADIDGLLRFMWPIGHFIVIEEKTTTAP